MSEPEALPAGVVRVRADNPSAMTLDGTNTYIAAGFVIDPGPADEAHLETIVATATDAIDGILLTHGHADHAEGAAALAERYGVEVLHPSGGERIGPFETLPTPGHSPDHVALLLGRIAFAGDTVLGAGSVFIPAQPGALAAYLDSLRRLRSVDLEVICPGHGPVIWNPQAKLDEYIAHRLEREERLLAAITAGARTHDELLAKAWSDVDFAASPMLRPAAKLTLRAHLDKLADEGRLPAEIER